MFRWSSTKENRITSNYNSIYKKIINNTLIIASMNKRPTAAVTAYKHYAERV